MLVLYARLGVNSTIAPPDIPIFTALEWTTYSALSACASLAHVCLPPSFRLLYPHLCHFSALAAATCRREHPRWPRIPSGDTGARTTGGATSCSDRAGDRNCVTSRNLVTRSAMTNYDNTLVCEKLHRELTELSDVEHEGEERGERKMYIYCSSRDQDL